MAGAESGVTRPTAPARVVLAAAGPGGVAQNVSERLNQGKILMFLTLISLG